MNHKFSYSLLWINHTSLVSVQFYRWKFWQTSRYLIIDFVKLAFFFTFWIGDLVVKLICNFGWWLVQWWKVLSGNSLNISTDAHWMRDPGFPVIRSRCSPVSLHSTSYFSSRILCQPTSHLIISTEFIFKLVLSTVLCSNYNSRLKNLY